MCRTPALTGTSAILTRFTRNSQELGIVAELMRDDARTKAEFMTDLMEIVAELANECLFAAGPGQEERITGQRLRRAKEAQPLNELAYERIHRD